MLSYRINSSMRALQHTERFGNRTYTLICGNHSVTVVQSPKSKSNANIKWRKYIYIDTKQHMSCFISFKMSLCCLCREAIGSSAQSYCKRRFFKYSSVSLYFWGEPNTNHQVVWYEVIWRYGLLPLLLNGWFLVGRFYCILYNMYILCNTAITVCLWFNCLFSF